MHQECPQVTRHATHARGFTYIEMVIVVMLLGVLAGVAAPRYQSAVAHAELRRAAYTLAADLRRVRDTALQTSAQKSLVFDITANAYWSHDVDDPDHPGSELFVDFGDARQGVSLSAPTFASDALDGDAAVSFNWNGDPVSGGEITVAVGGASTTVTVGEGGDVEVGL